MMEQVGYDAVRRRARGGAESATPRRPLGRPPVEEEIAAELGVSLDAYQGLLTKVGEMSLFSLEDLGFGAGEERFSFERALEEGDADPLGTLLTRERVAIVAEAIGRLPE